MERGVYAYGAYSGANLYYGLNQMMAVRGGLGVLVCGCLGAVCLADGMAEVVKQLLEDYCSRIFFCMFAMMPSNLVCASEQSLLRRVFAILLSRRRAVELVSGVLCPLRLRWAAMEGRTLARAGVKSFAVSMRVVLAWPMGMLTNSTRPQYFLRAVSRGSYLSVFWVYFSWHLRSLQKPTSKSMRENFFLLKASEDGSAGIPRA